MKLIVGLLYCLSLFINIRAKVTFTHLGCFKRGDHTPLDEGHINLLGNATVEKCVEYCSGDEYRYAKMQKGQDCRCGNVSYDRYGPGNGCGQPCTGNSSQSCGGRLSSDVYKIEYPTQNGVSSSMASTTIAGITAAQTEAISKTNDNPGVAMTTTAVEESTSVFTSLTKKATANATALMQTNTSVEIHANSTVTMTTIKLEERTTSSRTLTTKEVSGKHVDMSYQTNKSGEFGHSSETTIFLESNRRHNTGVAIGATVAAVVVCAVLAGAVILCRRARKKTNQRQGNVPIMDEDISQSGPFPEAQMLINIDGETHIGMSEVRHQLTCTCEHCVGNSKSTPGPESATPCVDEKELVYSLADPIEDDLVVVDNELYGN